MNSGELLCDDLSMAITFLKILKKKTIESNWYDIDNILHTITKGSKKGLDTFIQLLPEKKEKCCKKWLYFDETSFTVKTLAWMAKEEDENVYDVWNDVWKSNVLDFYIDTINDKEIKNKTTHSIIVKIIYTYFWLEFNYSEEGNWYFYDKYNNRWNKISSTELTIKIKEYIIGTLIWLLQQLKENILPSANENEYYKRNILGLHNLKDFFEQNTWFIKIRKQLETQFTTPHFETFLNKNLQVSSWGYCVTVTTKKDIKIMEGRPEYFLSEGGSLDVSNPPNLDMYCNIIGEYTKYIKSIFPDDEIRHYFYIGMASTLDKKNSKEVFRDKIKNKVSSNLIKLMELLWGNLVSKDPIKNNCIEELELRFNPFDLTRIIFYLAIKYYPGYLTEGLVETKKIRDYFGIKKDHIFRDKNGDRIDLITWEGDNIYLIRCETTHFYKIGHSMNIFSRIKELNVGNPFKLTLLACCPGDCKVEKIFHKKYKDNRVKGEWFSFSEEEIENVLKEFRELRT